MRVFIAYLVLLHAFCAVLVVKTDFLPRLKGKFPNAHAFVLRVQDAFSTADDVYVGDSLTLWMPVEGLKLAISGQTTEDLLKRLPYRSTSRAKRVFLLIGTNDLILGKEGVEKRLAAISAAIPAPLIWSTIPPSAEIDPVQLARVNAAIQSLCAARTNCSLVDTSFLGASWSNYLDGTHLSPKGYAAYLQAPKR